MHSTLPNSPKASSLSFDGLLASVLGEQNNFTAVERFANWHDHDGLIDQSSRSDQAPALAKHYASLMPTTAPGIGQQYAFEVDLDACSGCKACVVACHNLNGLETNETWRKVGWLTNHDVNLPIVQHVTTACHHCVEPGCLSGCPVKAYEKDPLTGIVRHLDDQCFGCKYCTMMCPYEVPQYSSTLGIVRKCDMCSQRLSLGEAPACVQACPNEAIRITLVQSLEVRSECRATSTALLPTAPPSHITLPTTKFISTRSQLMGEVVSQEAVIDHPHEGHLPLALMLVLTQASVGMWCILSGTLVTSDLPASDFLWIAITATIIGVVGVHLALLHLGRPWLAFRAFLGWRTSWLSREAIAFGIYMGASSLSAVAFFAPWLPMVFGTYQESLLHSLVASASLLTFSTAVVGLFAVACSAMIYVATQRALWDVSRTAVEFGATMLGFGLASVAALEGSTSSPSMLLLGTLVAAAGFGAKLNDQLQSRVVARSPLGIPWQDFSSRSGRLLDNELSKAWNTAWFCWFGSVSLAVAICVRLFPMSMFHPVAYLIVTLLFVSQLINRWLYFASIVTHRMPGAGP